MSLSAVFKTTLLLSFILLGSTTPAFAFEKVDDTYLEQLHGPSMQDDENNAPQVLKYPFTAPPWTNQIGFTANDTYDTRTFEANIDFAETTYGTPFFNAGFEITSPRNDDLSFLSETDTNRNSQSDFIVEAEGGLQIPLDEDVSFTGGYRFIDSEDPGFDAADLDFQSHEFRIGLTFKLQPDK